MHPRDIRSLDIGMLRSFDALSGSGAAAQWLKDELLAIFEGLPG